MGLMVINWQDVITSLGGNVILLGAVAWLFKTLVTNRFVLAAEEFKISLKAKADNEIERVRALLTRKSRIHERQVETLIKLYRHFCEAQTYLQRMAASGILEGEPTKDEYHRMCAEAIASAHDTFSDGRLLIPQQLAGHCGQFFNALFEGNQQLAFAQHPMIVDGLQRAEFWNRAKKTAYQEVPGILAQIEEVARGVIHGESLSSGTV